MKALEKIGLTLFHRLDPEKAHSLSLKCLQKGLIIKPPAYQSERLKTRFAGLNLANPLGLAAGYDKNAEAIAPLLNLGFGFIEVGAATPLPQPGNPKPRLFRLREDQAVINRFGFNNLGSDEIAKRLANRPKTGIVGLNLGANKTSENRALDYAKVLKSCAAYIDFATVNVSSPNTEKLRDLQGKAALGALLKNVMETRERLARPIPIFLKIAPDLIDAEIQDIAELALDMKLDAIIATNTTLDRAELKSQFKGEAGGLSGAPLFEKSTRVLAKLSAATEGAIPLIGVGGITSAQEAYAKIKAGASALQIYSGLVYHGLALIPEILEGLDKALEADGYETLSDAVGSGRAQWL